MSDSPNIPSKDSLLTNSVSINFINLNNSSYQEQKTIKDTKKYNKKIIKLSAFKNLFTLSKRKEKEFFAKT